MEEYIAEIIDTMYDDIICKLRNEKIDDYSITMEQELYNIVNTNKKNLNNKEAVRQSIMIALTKIEYVLIEHKPIEYTPIEHILCPDTQKINRTAIKNTVNMFLNKSGLVDFVKLDDIGIYSDNVKTQLMDIIKPEHIIYMVLYIKYHKIYDIEIFCAFIEMIGIEYSSKCICTLTYADKLASELYNAIFGEINQQKESKIAFYQNVYADFINITNEYKSFERYKPSIDDCSKALEKILRVENFRKEWNPSGEGEQKIYDSKVWEYIKKLEKYVRNKQIGKLDTSNRKVEQGRPNKRTIRSKSKEFLETFGLMSRELVSCPEFLIDELWECTKKTGVKGYADEKLERDESRMVDVEYIRLMGRLYIICVLAIAFDRNNYCPDGNSKTKREKFRELIENSLKNKDTYYLLKFYAIITDNNDDKDIVNEITKGKG